MKKLLVMLLIGLGLFQTSNAQFPTSYLVSGKVQDANGKPIENTKITLYRMADTFYKKPSIEQILNVPNDVLLEVLASVSSSKSFIDVFILFINNDSLSFCFFIPG